MRTLLIDDETHARHYLRDLLKLYPEIEVVGEASNGLEAIELTNQLRPDLLFLDIQMPVIDGFTLLSYLKTQPLIVFCTAHDQFALKAFETSAIDYLLKPVTAERLSLSLKKINREWEKITQVHAAWTRQEGLQTIVCQRNDGYHVFWLNDIQFFLKEGRYTAVQTETDGTFLTDLTLDYLEAHIHHPDFFRINRATMVRRDLIRHFHIQTHSTGALEMNGGQRFTISRSRLQDFKCWFLVQNDA